MLNGIINVKVLALFLGTLFLSFAISNCAKNTEQSKVVDSIQFRIGQYNIRYPAPEDEKTGNGWEVRKKPMAELITSHHFDIFGTQEGYDFMLEDLKGLLPGFNYIKHRYGSSNIHHNTAIFYKTSLFVPIDKGVFWFSETPDIPSIGWDATDKRICQWVKFKVRKTGQEFYFFNLHFYWRYKVAKEESGPLLVKEIKKIAGNSPVICTGDFNSTPETSQIIAVKKFLSDAYEVSKKPWDGINVTGFHGGVFKGKPVSRIDYIFVSHQFEVENYEIISDTYDGDRHPSDHLPVTALVILKN